MVSRTVEPGSSCIKPSAAHMSLCQSNLTDGQTAEILLKARELKAINPPSNRDYKSVLSFMENDEGQLYEKEMSYIYEKADLVTLRPGREHAWLDGVIETILKICRCGLLKVSFSNSFGQNSCLHKVIVFVRIRGSSRPHLLFSHI